ncbi:MAG: hypothetical protein OZ921_08110 [Sorangiineae bacterium]|nr:hypothetical protein [Polyangiaceae bacterium]MEB2322462.1 hypothetical protein [Sorangiineae bacterium]
MRRLSLAAGILGIFALGACSGSGSNGGAASGGGAGASSGGASSGGGPSSGGASGGGAVPTVGGCPIFTADDEWNRDISSAPVDATWTQRLRDIVGAKRIHPDFGGEYGIPYNVVSSSQPAVPIAFDDYPDESDPGPYPFPEPGSIAIEGNAPTSCDGDCHVLVVETGSCSLYEAWACEHRGGQWHCGNGAKWDLTRKSYGQRPMGWTSGDAAGLPILPGLARFEEAEAGAIRHAIRFTMHCSMAGYVEPATHRAAAGDCGSDAPPMGLRVRLAASYDVSSAPPRARAILTAMQRYGMILADNGSDFYFQGDENPGWTDDDLDALKAVPASAFEAITPGPIGNE